MQKWGCNAILKIKIGKAFHTRNTKNTPFCQNNGHTIGLICKLEIQVKFTCKKIQ